MRVYLAGPISGQTYDQATEWRNQAKTALAVVGIQAYSPMRRKEVLNTDHVIDSDPSTYHENPLTTAQGIMCRDHHDCINADAVLIYFGDIARVSLGTAMELAWCYDRHIPVVVVAKKDNPNICHPMAQQAIDFRVETLAEGIELIQTILVPEA